MPDDIYSDDRAREPIPRFVRLWTAGALVMAIASALPPQVNAQEVASAPPARSTASVPAPGTDTASKFDEQTNDRRLSAAGVTISAGRAGPVTAAEMKKPFPRYRRY